MRLMEQLVEAVARGDVLSVLSSLSQLSGTPSSLSIEAEEIMPALEAAVAIRSPRSLLITKILLEFRPDFASCLSRAEEIAESSGNLEALKVLNAWALGDRGQSVSDLLMGTLEEAEVNRIQQEYPQFVGDLNIDIASTGTESKGSEGVVKMEQIDEASFLPQRTEMEDKTQSSLSEKPILQTCCTPDPTVTPPTRSHSPTIASVSLPSKPSDAMCMLPDSLHGYFRVYVGNLHPSVLSKDLLAHFATIVPANNLSIILTRLPTTQYAFVVFPSKSSALLAIEKLQGIRLLGNCLYFEADPFPLDLVGRRRHVDCWIEHLPASNVSEEVEAIILAKVPLVGKLVLKPYYEGEGMFGFFTVRSEDDAKSVMDGALYLGDHLLEITRFLPVGAAQPGEARSPVVPMSYPGSAKRTRSSSPPSARASGRYQPDARHLPGFSNDESIRNSAHERYRSDSLTTASTKFRNKYILPQEPPPLDASMNMLRDWSRESWIGRVPADAPIPHNFHQTSRLAKLSHQRGEEVGWRTHLCRLFPPTNGGHVCKGRTCDFAHTPEELRNIDGSWKGLGAPHSVTHTISSTASKVTATLHAEDSFAKKPLMKAPPPAALALSQEDILSWNRLTSTPFPPPQPNFARTVVMPLSFGYLSPPSASEALYSQAPFAEDQELQAQYEEFLLAQSGEARDYFSLPCGETAGFNDLCGYFGSTARDSAIR